MTSTGALIMVFFATVWWVVGLRTAGHGAALVYVPPLIIAAALAGFAWRLTRTGGGTPATNVEVAERARRDRLVMWASAAEGVALFLVAGVLLPTIGHRDATAPMIALIVGLHFVPLARGLPARAYYVTAAALTGLGLVGFGIADINARITLVTAGAAIVLWLTAIVALRGARGSTLSRLGSSAA